MQREKFICENQGNQTLNCSGVDAVIDILHAELLSGRLTTEVCSTSEAPKKTFAKQPSCIFDSDVSSEVKSICQERAWCNLSLKSVGADRCPTESKHLDILYKCVRRSKSITAG